MKKIKNKGKVYPSPCSSNDGDSFSVLNLLPAAILALASVLCLEDREVLAYLITRSIKTTATASSKKVAANEYDHKPPVFGCVCFDCYTSYWFRWDSSPNRELIHQAIEAFEDHLTNGGGGVDETDHHNHNKYKKNGKHKTKRRDKTARRFADKSRQQLVVVEESEAAAAAAETFPENNVAVAPVSSPDKEPKRLEKEEDEDEVVVVEVSGESTPVEEDNPAVLWLPAAAASSYWLKGLARKVLPDVLGLFNSRLWSLWSPNA